MTGSESLSGPNRLGVLSDVDDSDVDSGFERNAMDTRPVASVKKFYADLQADLAESRIKAD